jgi:hypothetical protein
LFAFCKQVTEHMTNFEDVTRFWAIRRDTQNAAVCGFNLLSGFITLKGVDRLAFFDGVTVPF